MRRRCCLYGACAVIMDCRVAGDDVWEEERQNSATWKPLNPPLLQPLCSRLVRCNDPSHSCFSSLLQPSTLQLYTMIAPISKTAAIGVLFMIIGSSQGASLRGQQRDLEEGGYTTEEGTMNLDPPVLARFISEQDYGLTATDKDFEGEQRIVGGEQAGLYDGSSYTMILRDNGAGASFSGCGATLITNCHLLTAAHCIGGSRTGLNDKAYVNAKQPYANPANAGAPYHYSSITSETQNPSYNSYSHEHDVAILRLGTCVPSDKFGSSIKAARLSTSNNLSSGETVTTMGFGNMQENVSTKPNELRKVAINYITPSDCRSSSYTYGDKIKDNDMICAGASGGGKDACQADSGGPLYRGSVTSDGDLELVGVVSWGAGCARSESPGVYSSTAAHFSWIEQRVCVDDSSGVDMTNSPVCSGYRSEPSNVDCSSSSEWFTYPTTTGSAAIQCSQMIGNDYLCGMTGATDVCPFACHPDCL